MRGSAFMDHVHTGERCAVCGIWIILTEKPGGIVNDERLCAGCFEWQRAARLDLTRQWIEHSVAEADHRQLGSS